MGMHSAPPEKRAYARVPIALAGKAFFPLSGAEQDCIVTDISLGGATLQCGFALVEGMQLVLYLEGFGRFAGRIVRADAEEAGMRFDGSEGLRAHTAERIVRYLAGMRPDEAKLRRSERIALPRRLTRGDGEIVEFEVRDLSLTGAALICTARPAIGEILTIGTAKGRVMRHFDEGIGVEFVTERPPA